MKKVIVTATFIILFLALTLSASAQTAAPIPTRTPKGQQMKQEVKERVTEQKEERREALTQARQEKIKAFFNRMVARFEAAVARLQKLIDRIQTRINKIKEENSSADVADEQNQLDTAKDKLKDAGNKMLVLKDGLENLLASDNPKTAFKTIGENVRDLKQDLIEIHKILVQIIGDIKGLRVGQGSPKPTATP